MADTKEKNNDGPSSHICFPLATIHPTSLKNDQELISVIVPREDRCGSCGRHLFTLFDFDLRNPAFSFFGLHGQQLRIAMCPTCTSLDEAVFTDVNGNGLSQWSLDNGEEPVEPLENLDDWEDLPQLPSQQLRLGPLRTIPYEGSISCQQKGLSYIGNVPTWIHFPEYPTCPECQQKMVFIGQLALADLRDDAEGIVYAFLCSTCGKAANAFQQS